MGLTADLGPIFHENKDQRGACGFIVPALNFNFKEGRTPKIATALVSILQR